MIFKIEKFRITLRITQYRRKVFSSEFSFESWLDIFLYTTVPIFPLYDAVKSLTTVLVWALQLKNISRRIHPDGHKVFGYLVWSNFIIQKRKVWYFTLIDRAIVIIPFFFILSSDLSMLLWEDRVALRMPGLCNQRRRDLLPILLYTDWGYHGLGILGNLHSALRNRDE